MVRKSLPLAQQVVQEILSGIEVGNLARDGGLLPSEAELSRRFDVSRATIREALSKLEQRGVIYRRHGVGTFVSPPQPVLEAGFEQLESIHTLAERIGLKTHMGEAEIIERDATPYDAQVLEITPGTSVLSVTRTILAGTQPIAYLVDVVPTIFLRESDLGESFDGSVLDILIQRSDPVLSHSNTNISTEVADLPTARKLHIQRGDMLLKLDAQLYSRDGHIVDYSLSYFVPGYFRFHVVRRIDPCESRTPSPWSGAVSEKLSFPPASR
jgi:GntR family transcriptional regulator